MSVVMNYKGASMHPTLKTGDRLDVIPYNDRHIRVGDIVLFHEPQGNIHIAHRIVFITPQGITTRGDNSILNDSKILCPDVIVGRIVSAKRDGKHFPIHGGTRGRISAVTIRTKKHIDTKLSRILRPVYHRLSGAGIFIKYNRFLPKIQVISFQKSGGTELQLLMGQRIIGRRLPEINHWQIKRPFRLFFNEASLPK